ncbi:Gamma-soluble NSF attachment protein [Camellia lanceoleosa]|uniref:Gamma-soluble NSF attachment protein n=1 Tax=Camellia lanceoleosa TaxID=1840588 RepID=A0ACC0HKQ8_9ERIC|nr:Gamma-soluble NSF attachment protein [Camellia lanceoleosa]
MMLHARYADAATFLLRRGLAADKCNATHSQCKTIRLARKLPDGDASALRSDAAKEQEEALDEDDLTWLILPTQLD